MWIALVDPNRSVQKNQPAAVISLGARLCSSGSAMLRLLLTASLLLAPLAITHVATSLTNEEDQFKGCAVQEGIDCDLCSDLCRSCPKPDAWYGCNIPTCSGSPFTLLPFVHSYYLGPPNNDRPQPRCEVNPDISTYNRAGQCLLIDRDSLSRCVDFEENCGLTVVHTDGVRCQDGIVDECKENFDCDDKYVKRLLGRQLNKGSFLFPLSNQHRFILPSYSDEKAYVNYPSVTRAPGTGPSDQDCGRYGYEYEQPYPELEQSTLPSTDDPGSYLTDGNCDTCAQQDYGYEHLNTNQELYLPSKFHKGSFTPYDGQYFHDQTLFSPTVQLSYEYDQLFPKQGMSKLPFSADNLSPYLKYGYGYENFFPKLELSRHSSTIFPEKTVDASSSSDNFSGQYEQSYPNWKEFRNPSTSLVQKGLLENISPSHINRYEHFLPGKNRPINYHTNVVQIRNQSDNKAADLTQYISDYELRGTITVPQSRLGPEIPRVPFQKNASLKNSHDGVLSPHGIGYEHPYVGQDIQKLPSSLLFNSGSPKKVSHGHPTERITEYDQTYSEDDVGKLHLPKGVRIQHGLRFEKLLKGNPKIPSPDVDQISYPTNVRYTLPTDDNTDNDQLYQEQNVPVVHSPDAKHSFVYKKPHIGQGFSNIPSPIVASNGYSSKFSNGLQSEDINKFNQLYPEQNVQNMFPPDSAPSAPTNNLGQDQIGTFQGISNIPSLIVPHTGHPMKFGDGLPTELITENDYLYQKQNFAKVYSPSRVSTHNGFGHEQSQTDEGILNSPSLIAFNTNYQKKFNNGFPMEHINENDHSYQNQQTVPNTYSPSFGYEESHIRQGISNSPSPIVLNSGHPMKAGQGHPSEQITENEKSHQEQNVPKAYSPRGMHTPYGLGHEKSQDQGISYIPSPSVLPVLPTGYPKKGGNVLPTESISEYGQSLPEHIGEAPSSPTGISTQQDLGIEESHPRQGFTNILSTSDFKDVHPQSNAYNEKQPPPQFKLPSTTGIQGNPLNSYRHPTQNNFGRKQIHPTEGRPKLLTPAGVQSPWTKDGIGGNNPVHDGSFLNDEFETTIGIPSEVEQQTIKLFDGCSVSYNQLQDIIRSFQSPQECVLTVPNMFSGPLHEFAHVMDSFPASIDVSDAFVHLTSDLLVPFDCYKHIASVFARDLPLFQESCGEVLDDGQFVDSSTIASIVASSRTPERRLILTHNDLALPFKTYKDYIGRILPEDKNSLRVVLPEVKKPIPYGTYKQVFEKYVDRLQKGSVLDQNKTIKLLGSKTKLSLEQFLAVINNCHIMKEATVTLPSKKTMTLESFIPLVPVLGDDYSRSCLVSIPNTPHVLPFTVVKEIFKLYLEKKTIDLSKDTDVNWKFEGDHRPYKPDDVEIFSINKIDSHKGPLYKNFSKELTTGFNCPYCQEQHYLLCRPHHFPNYPYYNEAGNAEDGHSFPPYDKEPPSLKIPRPGPVEPVYACERFEKYTPK